MKAKSVGQILLTAALLLLATAGLRAQEFNHKVYYPGDHIIGIGAGLGRSFHGSGPGPAFLFEYENLLYPVGPGIFGLGATLGYSSLPHNHVEAGLTYRGRWSVIVGDVRVVWHVGWGVDKLDTYIGLNAGFQMNQYRQVDIAPVKPDFKRLQPNAGAFLGASWHVTPGFAIFVQGGYDICLASAGAIVQF